MIRKKSEDAASPVIGVMLMLVVTIIIAAVVAAFAGGIGSNAEPTPTTVVDVVSISDGYMEAGDIKLNTASYNIGANYYIAYDEEWNQVPNKNSDGAYYMVFYDKDNPDIKYAMKTHDGPPNKWDPSKTDWSSYKPYNGNQELFEKYMTIPYNFKNEPTVTLSCLHGDSLDLSKVSIQVISTIKGTTIEIPQKTFSGVLSVGDTINLKLGSSIGGQGSIVDVIVLYGNHKIATEEQMKITRG